MFVKAEEVMKHALATLLLATGSLRGPGRELLVAITSVPM
jgi:hypothetical protein